MFKIFEKLVESGPKIKAFLENRMKLLQRNPDLKPMKSYNPPKD